MTVAAIRRSLPVNGIAVPEVLEQLAARRAGDWPWREGRSFSLVYHAGDAHDALLREAYGLYLNANGLSARGFPSLATLETDIVSMTASLLAEEPTEIAGAMTSGGSESIILAMKTYRDRARAAGAGVTGAEIVLPRSAHPAFLKAASYFDLTPVIVDCAADFRADADAMAAACTPRTIAMVASAPSFPQGVIDPIAAIGGIARERGIGLHIDASLGGFMLPFLERLGHAIPGWNFRVAGVTSMSADLHKFGYSAKGASVVLYRSGDLRRHQFFATDQWSGGVFASAGLLGTRPGGAIAAAWAALHAFGERGYCELAARALDTARRLQQGIARLGLRVLGAPEMSVFAFTGSDDGPSVLAIADRMETRGWRLDRLQRPDSIHLIVTASHDGIVDPFLADLEISIAEAREAAARGGEAPRGPAVLYGMTGNITAGGDPIATAIAGLEGRWTTD